MAGKPGGKDGDAGPVGAAPGLGCWVARTKSGTLPGVFDLKRFASSIRRLISSMVSGLLSAGAGAALGAPYPIWLAMVPALIESDPLLGAISPMAPANGMSISRRRCSPRLIKEGILLAPICWRLTRSVAKRSKRLGSIDPTPTFQAVLRVTIR
jgi:hypothetical protein